MIYAIGDIHGCLSALKELIGQLPIKPEDELVFLGDYIDRGPESKGVLDYLVANEKPNWRFLRGNHEQMLLEWLGTPNSLAAANWLLLVVQRTDRRDHPVPGLSLQVRTRRVSSRREPGNASASHPRSTAACDQKTTETRSR